MCRDSTEDYRHRWEVVFQLSKLKLAIDVFPAGSYDEVKICG